MLASVFEPREKRIRLPFHCSQPFVQRKINGDGATIL